MTFRRRALTALAASAVALPLLALPAAAAPGDTPIPPAQDIRTFCTNPTADDFVDVVTSGDSNAEELSLAIRCLASAITTTAGDNDADVVARGNPLGIGEDRYGPQLNVRRDQMSSFIARLIDAASVRERTPASIRELPAPAAGQAFADVAANNVHSDNIKRLEQAGIVQGNPGTPQQPQGIGANRFGPELSVTRSQMASFINRAVAYATGGNPGAAGTPGNGFSAPTAEYYVDAQQQVHVNNVNGITSAGIANGVGQKRYDGLGTVSRQQMARFLARTLSDLFDTDDIYSLLEVFSPELDQADVQRFTAADESEFSATATARTFTVDDLNPDVEYRATIVDADNVDRPTDTDLVEFDEDGTTGFVDTGAPAARFTGVSGNADGGSFEGFGQTIAVTPDNDGTVSFTIASDEQETVVVAFYINGGAGQELNDGGTSPRLEIDDNGRPLEFFGISGETEFVDAPVDPVDPVTPRDLSGDTIEVTPDNTATISFTGANNATANATRSFTATGLVPGVEYRITLVNADNATRGQGGFATDDPRGVQFATAAVPGTAQGFAVNTGDPQADILTVDGAAPMNNAGPNTPGAFTGPSAVFTADADGTVVFVIQGQTPETVFPVVYVNGGGDGSQNTAGSNTNPRLETNQAGFAIEGFDLGGDTVFQNRTP